MIDMFPRLTHKVSPEKQLAQKKLLVRTFNLELDKNNCRNCGVCYNVCPVDAITKGAPGASIKNKNGDRIMSGVVLHPDSCSYCGTCSYLCPFDALHLVIDGEKVPDDELQLVEKGALPKLVKKEVELKEGKKGIQYMEGHLEYAKEACESGCRTCINICPTGALSFKKPENPWERESFVIDRDTCIYCGACAFSCPTGAIKIFREKINHEGKYTDPFWPNIVNKLIDFHGREK
mgnify:CR=1 FL=1